MGERPPLAPPRPGQRAATHLLPPPIGRRVPADQSCRSEPAPVVATHRRSATNDVVELRLARRGEADGSPVLQLVASVLCPGSAMLRRAPIVGIAFVIVGFIVPAVLAANVVVNRERIIGIVLDRDFLLAVAILGPVAVLARLIAVAEVADVFRGVRFIRLQVAAAVVVVATMGAAATWVTTVGLDTRRAVLDVFGDENADPISTVMTTDESGEIFSPTGDPQAPLDAAVDVASDEEETDGGRLRPPPDEVRNTLIMGVDSGPEREGRRTDTMMLVSVHAASGRTALLSIPRNLAGLRFPPDTPLGERYETGFDDFANAVFATVAADPALAEPYGSFGFPAEPVALVSGISHSLDVRIDDFVLIDMIGFADVVDAVGGVTIELCQAVSLPPSLDGETPVEPEIGPGQIDMNGVTALAYARTRYADSDYERTGRQRQLLAALSSQVALVEAIGAFTTVATVLDESLRTSLTADEFDGLLQTLGDNSAVVESVGLVPPFIEPGDPDYDTIRRIVSDVRTAIVTGAPSGYTPLAGPEDPNDRTTDEDGNCLD